MRHRPAGRARIFLTECLETRLTEVGRRVFCGNRHTDVACATSFRSAPNLQIAARRITQNAAKRRRERACARIPEIERDPRHRLPSLRRAIAASMHTCWRHTAKLTPVCARNCRVNVRRLAASAATWSRSAAIDGDASRCRHTFASRASAGSGAATGAASSRFPRPAAPSACPRARRRRTGPASRSHRRSVAAAAPIRHTHRTAGQARLLRGGAGHERVEHRDRPGHRHFVPHAGRHPARAAAAPASVRAASTR